MAPGSGFFGFGGTCGRGQLLLLPFILDDDDDGGGHCDVMSGEGLAEWLLA